MAQVTVGLRNAMETSLISLYGKAVDAQMDPTILGDTMAARAVAKLDYNFKRLKWTVKQSAPSTAARAKHFDDWTAAFLATHPQATVLHLGAGFDTRVWRVDPGPEVTWYDVDYPQVIDIRKKLYPERENYHLIGCSVTALEWLDKVRSDLPTLVVAEGLTMYLRPEEGHELFGRLTERFPSGVIAFDAHNRLARRMVSLSHLRTVGSGILHWTIEDEFELEEAVPRMRCLDVLSALSAPSSAELPLSTRTFATLTRPIPVLRDLGLYFRYEFGPEDET